MRQAEQILEQGKLPQVDMMRSVPVGRNNAEQFTLYPHVLAYAVRGLRILFPDLTLTKTAIFYPVVGFTLILPLFFLLARQLTDASTALLASEMVVKAVQVGLHITEVPITYHPRAGESKLNSLRDAWRHLRFMLLLSPTHLFVLPGSLLFLLGLLLMLLLLPGPLQVGAHAYDVHVMTLAGFLTLLGYQVLSMGLCACAVATVTGMVRQDSFIQGFYQLFHLERGLALGLLLFLGGVLLDARVAWIWIQNGFGDLDQIRPALFALVLGVQTAFSAFLLSILRIPVDRLKSDA